MIEDPRVTLAHGNGGRFMRELVAEVFAARLANPWLDVDADSAAVPLGGPGELLVTTDGFTVHPLEFPGGDIGSLAVHGTINDLAVAGATPHWLTLNAFIEEGLELDLLRRVVASLAAAARDAGVRVVAGDTKVVRRGEGGGLYLATTGVGTRPPSVRLGLDRVRTGDAVLLSGPIGDHGICVMLAREEFGMRGDLRSDSASVLPLTLPVRELDGVRFMRDPTRGGLATVCHDLARASGGAVRLDEPAIPVRDPVRSVCAMLGYDPMYLACEGRVVAAVAPEVADTVLACWREVPGGELAARIGTIEVGPVRVVLTTELGGERVVEELEDDPLPRIC